VIPSHHRNKCLHLPSMTLRRNGSCTSEQG
jgi:hypothetical protein